jgi:hypothetical protein
VTYVYMQEFEIGDRSTANYDFMKEKIGDQKIEGLLVHTAGFDDESGVWRMLDVWESKDLADRFMERMMSTVRVEELPRPDTAAQAPLREAHYELHDFSKN